MGPLQHGQFSLPIKLVDEHHAGHRKALPFGRFHGVKPAIEGMAAQEETPVHDHAAAQPLAEAALVNSRPVRVITEIRRYPLIARGSDVVLLEHQVVTKHPARLQEAEVALRQVRVNRPRLEQGLEHPGQAERGFRISLRR